MNPESDNLYRSANIGLNAYLIFRGCALLKFECERGKVTFCFLDQDQCGKLAREYLERKATVDPMVYSFNLKAVLEMREAELKKV